MGILQPIVTIVLFFLILGTLVVIHELGHFVAARIAGVRVLEFGIGFPPRAKVLRSKGETLYTLNWLPIGGFVKLEGEDGDNATDPRAFSSKSLPVRLGILVSGVVMNVLLAFVIFTGIVWLASPQVGAKFAEVQPGSPAASAGLQPGETIVAVNGERFQVFVAQIGRRRARISDSRTTSPGCMRLSAPSWRCATASALASVSTSTPRSTSAPSASWSSTSRRTTSSASWPSAWAQAWPIRT